MKYVFLIKLWHSFTTWIQVIVLIMGTKMISSKRLYYDKAFRSFSDGFDDSNVIQNLF